MKVTADLPADMIRQIKAHALRKGQPVDHVAAELLRTGLAAEAAAPHRRRRVNLPLIKCRQAAELSPDRVAEVLVEQEARWAGDDTSGRSS